MAKNECLKLEEMGNQKYWMGEKMKTRRTILPSIFSKTKVDQMCESIASLFKRIRASIPSSPSKVRSGLHDKKIQEIWAKVDSRINVKNIMDFDKFSLESVFKNSGDSKDELIEYAKDLGKYVTDADLTKKKNKYIGQTLESYRSLKYEKDIKTKDKKDYRPTINETGLLKEGQSGFCGHGTTLTSALLAIKHSNKQLVPGFKQTKLGIDTASGESSGVTSLNSKYVSAVDLRGVKSNVGVIIKYANKSVEWSKKRNLQNSDIPVVILGDGVDDINVGSSVANEAGYKRVNIRLLCVPEKEISLIKELLRQQGIKDIKLMSTEKLLENNQKRTKDQPLIFKDLWKKATLCT